MTFSARIMRVLWVKVNSCTWIDQCSLVRAASCHTDNSSQPQQSVNSGQKKTSAAFITIICILMFKWISSKELRWREVVQKRFISYLSADLLLGEATLQEAVIHYSLLQPPEEDPTIWNRRWWVSKVINMCLCRGMFNCHEFLLLIWLPLAFQVLTAAVGTCSVESTVTQISTTVRTTTKPKLLPRSAKRTLWLSPTKSREYEDSQFDFEYWEWPEWKQKW